MRITRWLPNEVLGQIIQNAPRADQATLCRVSKLFHALVLPYLLRTVFFETTSEAGFSDRHPVGCALLSYRNSSSRSEPPEALIKSLKLMRKLEHLRLDDYLLASHLANFTFPNLFSCTLFVGNAESESLHIPQFLSRHPTITHLRLPHVTGEDLEFPAPEFPLPDGCLLPRLQFYDGAVGWLPSFSTRSLAAVRTNWTVKLPSLVKKLSALTSSALTVSLGFVSGDQIPTLLEELSIHLPHLGVFKLNCWGRPGDEEILTQLTATLPRFKCLEYLEHEYRPGRWPVDVHHDRTTLQTWANICPTLKGACIREIASRKIGENWEKCSKKEFDTAAFSVFKNFLTGDY
ncbi:hypothetical protein FB45DRAFT_931304 [Roridomyces roridus]|uniref:F-box domain-containing protein n=1 Tax=Roridomyces roridus TaxID=1738132 RepID=A0AAD7BFX7_9AGAR|nr:hypothetical protein FB45DRAFT_931304 [Roridomyces roridus]